MTDVFISYSRKNSDFVHKLDDALTAEKREVWVDWQDIARGEDWWHSIQVGVDSTDTALIVITENWLVSPICARELEYIRKQNKRVFPIIRQKIEGDVALRVKGTWVDQDWEKIARDNWKYLSSLNWLFFDDDTTFDSALKDLLTALDTDQVYVKSHTRYLVRALEWQQSKLDPSFLLEGDQLESAQTWLQSSVGKHPEPHPVHHEYVTASKVADTARTAREKAREHLVRRFRQASIGLGVGVVVAIIAAVFVGQQFLAARAEVTKAGATLQQVNLQVTAAINQQVTAAAKVQNAEALVSTATIEQGKAIFAQQTSAAGEKNASIQIAIAGATISPVAPTLTAVASAIYDANLQQDVALALVNASLQMSNNNVPMALQLADQMVADYPDQALAYVGRGTMLDSANKPDEAVADYTRAIEIDPERSDAYLNRGQIYGAQNKYDEAIDDFTHAIEIDPENADNYLFRGQSYGILEKWDEALADYAQALELNPHLAEVYLLRATIYAEQDKVAEANADYWQWVDQSEINSQQLETIALGKTPFSTTVNIVYGFNETIPFEAKAGQEMQAEAEAAEGAAIDPLLILLDPQGKPIFANDDSEIGTSNSEIADVVLPVDGVYTLVVSHSGAGSDGDINVTIDLKTVASLTPSPSPTPQ